MTQTTTTYGSELLSRRNLESAQKLATLVDAAKPTQWTKSAMQTTPGLSLAAQLFAIVEIQAEIGEIKLARAHLRSQNEVLEAAHEAARKCAATKIDCDAAERRQSEQILQIAKREARKQGDSKTSHRISEALIHLHLRPSEVREMHRREYQKQFELLSAE